MPEDERTTPDSTGPAEAGMREVVPQELVASGEIKVFGVAEVARHRFSAGEGEVPPLEGHLVSLQLGGTPGVVTRCGGDYWEGVQVRGDMEIFPAGLWGRP